MEKTKEKCTTGALLLFFFLEKCISSNSRSNRMMGTLLEHHSDAHDADDLHDAQDDVDDDEKEQKTAVAVYFKLTEDGSSQKLLHPILGNPLRTIFSSIGTFGLSFKIMWMSIHGKKKKK